MIARPFALAALLLTVTVARPAPAQSMPAADRVAFNKLVNQRDRLAGELRQLDEEASGLIKQDRDATVVHAEQVSIQDQLDLVELRLDILAIRHGVAVPPAPRGQRNAGPGLAGVDDGSARRIEEAFDRGRSRALERIRRDALAILAALDFEGFLDHE